MNERIRLLAEQAILAVDIVTGNETLDDELAKMYIPDCFAEKFAELIVQECYEHCKGEMLDHQEAESAGLKYNDGVMDCAVGILLHFGVE